MVVCLALMYTTARVCSLCSECHYFNVIMTTMASQIPSLTVAYPIVYSGADQRKHQSSVSLAFVRRIHRSWWIPRTKGQLRGKCFHLMTSSCGELVLTDGWFILSVHTVHGKNTVPASHVNASEPDGPHKFLSYMSHVWRVFGFNFKNVMQPFYFATILCIHSQIICDIFCTAICLSEITIDHPFRHSNKSHRRKN